MGKQTLEQLYAPELRGPLTTQAQSRANQWAGRTTLSSGQATAVISTTCAKSDMLVHHTLQLSTLQNSGFGAPCVVTSINPGNSFTMGWADGVGRAFNSTIMWRLEYTS